MIGSLRGKLTSKQAPQIIIECHGVGYEVETPMSTFLDLPSIGDDLFLFTHLLVREDAQTLYGFSTENERSLFRSLLRISGVGAKMGLAILSAMSVADFQRCVEYEDAATLVKIPGVGKKTAERLIIELRDRLDAVPADSAALAPGAVAAAGRDNPVEDAVNALVGLGYKPQEASRMVRAVNATDLGSEEIIRQALQATVQ